MRGPASSSLITEHQEKGEKSDMFMQVMVFRPLQATMSHITCEGYEMLLPATRRICRFFKKIMKFFVSVFDFC
jgi:hypothetical protein